MLSLANSYTLYFRLYFRLCICLNKLSINQCLYMFIGGFHGLVIQSGSSLYICSRMYVGDNARHLRMYVRAYVACPSVRAFITIYNT